MSNTQLSKRIMIFYASALITIALLALFSQGLSQYALHQEITIRSLASVLGQQRGRSAVVEDDLEKLWLFPEQRTILLAKTKVDLKTWDTIQQAAYHGSIALSIPVHLPSNIRSILDSSTSEYTKMYVAGVTTLTRKDILPQLRLFAFYQFDYQAKMLTLYTIYTTQANQQLQTIQIIELLLCMLTIITLIGEYAFVFIPTTRRLHLFLKNLES